MSTDARTIRLANDEATSQAYLRWRERFIRPMLLGATVFGFVALVLALATNQGWIQNAVFIGAYGLVVLVTFLHAPYWLRVTAFLFAVYGLGLSELLSTGILGDAALFFLGLVLFATLMFSDRAGFIAILVTLLTFAAVGVLEGLGMIHLLNPGAMHAAVSDWVSTSATMALFGVTFILGMQQLQAAFRGAQDQSAAALQALEEERAQLEERVDARTLQLTAVNEVGRVASSILDAEELAARVANLITDQFGYYYAALFLVNETGEDARLYSATGEAGRVLKENKHHLRVGGNSMVGTAISTGKPRVALDVGAESVRFQNPLLPYTRSEIALPLTVGERILGALDVQSTKAGAFGPQEIDTLQGMATQVAVALENARLFSDAQRNLAELEAIQRHYVLESWMPYRGADALEYRLGEEDQANPAARLEVPLSLRDEVIGTINLAGEAEWTTEQRNLIETVANQAALALENARLVEVSQLVARREHELADITSKIWTASTIDGILQTAVQELCEALEGTEATIQLKMDVKRDR
ncbi:MAG TPA: GAF domain-containing protein [Anaerolineales bacterium]|nr:GAF domain-containing protein [Anaerolineales bacterium]